MRRISAFINAEDGSVGADWVVLTACVVGLGSATALTVATGAVETGTKVGTYVAAVDVAAAGEASDDTNGDTDEVTAPDEADAAEEARDETDAEEEQQTAEDNTTDSSDGTTEEAWTPPASTDWNGKHAGNYWGSGASQAKGDRAVAKQIALSEAAGDAPPGFNLDNPLYSPSHNAVVYTSNTGTHYSVNGHVTEVGANGSFTDQWGGTRSVRAWDGS